MKATVQLADSSIMKDVISSERFNRGYYSKEKLATIFKKASSVEIITQCCSTLKRLKNFMQELMARPRDCLSEDHIYNPLLEWEFTDIACNQLIQRIKQSRGVARMLQPQIFGIPFERSENAKYVEAEEPPQLWQAQQMEISGDSTLTLPRLSNNTNGNCQQIEKLKEAMIHEQGLIRQLIQEKQHLEAKLKEKERSEMMNWIDKATLHSMSFKLDESTKALNSKTVLLENSQKQNEALQMRIKELKDELTSQKQFSQIALKRAVLQSQIQENAAYNAKIDEEREKMERRIQQVRQENDSLREENLKLSKKGFNYENEHSRIRLKLFRKEDEVQKVNKTADRPLMIIEQLKQESSQRQYQNANRKLDEQANSEELTKDSNQAYQELQELYGELQLANDSHVKSIQQKERTIVEMAQKIAEMKRVAPQ